MKLLCSLLILLAALPVFSFASPIWNQTPLNYRTKNFHMGYYMSSVTNTQKKFIVRVPKRYVPGQPVELVYFLAGGSGEAENMATALEYLSPYLDNPIFDNVLFVAPDAKNAGLWSDTPIFKNEQMVFELIEYIERNIPHTPGRKLIGHSLGGTGALHFAYKYGNKFDAMASISPAILKWSPFEVTDELIKNYIRDHAPNIDFDYFKMFILSIRDSFAMPEYWKRYDFYERLPTQNLPKCYAIFTGAKDSLGFAFLGREFIRIARTYNKNVLYYEDPSRDHAVDKSILEVMQFFRTCQ
ncbi:MAG: alpha/beta fold hydrolase [Bdellovibrionales bacterium]